MTPQKFQKGATVQRINDPTFGIVLEPRFDEQTETWNYQVRFGARVATVPESVLCLPNEMKTPYEHMAEGKVAGQSYFRLNLTLQRLRRPPSRIANSFASARTQLYPHQFKPVLKFLDNPSKRLLIADDVGLGKTIEAGYILTELKAHQVLSRVLVVVPARLRTKWKKEMQDRFGEHFEIRSRSDLHAAVRSANAGRPPDNFKWIVSYESARDEALIDAIDGSVFPIDLLICDESHRLRNSEAKQHKIGQLLCGQADSVIFLSATPVQNKEEDLFNQFRLLSPEEFPDLSMFSILRDSNRPLLQLQRLVKPGQFDSVEALNLLEVFCRTQFGEKLSNTSLVHSIRARLKGGKLDRSATTELQSDIGRISPIDHLLSRTRRAEAIHGSAVRSANWVHVKFNEWERSVYNAVREHWVAPKISCPTEFV